MSPEELKAHARRFADELLTQGDLAVASELFTPGCRHDAPDLAAPGDAGVASWVAELRRAFPDLRAIVEDEIAEGDMVVLRLSLAGTHAGTLGDMPARGRRASWPLVTILHVGPEGRFVEVWLSWDRLSLFAQLSVRSDAEDGARAPPMEAYLP